MEWSARLALDVMGLASFSYSFGGMESFTGHDKSRPQNNKTIASLPYLDAVVRNRCDCIALGGRNVFQPDRFLHDRESRNQQRMVLFP